MFILGNIMPFKEIENKFLSIRSAVTKEEGEKLYTLARECSDGVIVEIGSKYGRSTICLGHGSKEGKANKVYAIDPHINSYECPSSYDEFKKNISDADLDSIVETIVSTSEKATINFNEPVGLIFIDGDHTENMVKIDFEAWFPKVKEGGIMAFHDVAAWWPGPKNIVKRFVIDSRNFSDIGFTNQIIFAKKVNQNSLWDRIRNKIFYNMCIIRGNLNHYHFEYTRFFKRRWHDLTVKCF